MRNMAIAHPAIDPDAIGEFEFSALVSGAQVRWQVGEVQFAPDLLGAGDRLVVPVAIATTATTPQPVSKAAGTLAGAQPIRCAGLRRATCARNDCRGRGRGLDQGSDRRGDDLCGLVAEVSRRGSALGSRTSSPVLLLSSWRRRRRFGPGRLTHHDRFERRWPDRRAELHREADDQRRDARGNRPERDECCGKPLAGLGSKTLVHIRQLRLAMSKPEGVSQRAHIACGEET